MSEYKEVWHVWDRQTVIANAVKASGDVGIADISKDEISLGMLPCDSEFSAYTTGQMRRRVECDCRKPETECVGLDYDGKCTECNGKGYQWEYKQC
jgi:hypothetical protein